MNDQQQRIRSKKTTTTTTRTNRNRRLRKQAKNKVAKNQSAQLRTIVSKCTSEYAKALVNPFGTRLTLPCIPDNIVLPSLKIQTRVRGVFSTGTLGVGFVSLNPWEMIVNDNALVGAACNLPVVYTTPVYDQSDYRYTVLGGVFTSVGTTAANSNSNLTTAFITSGGRQLRLVAAGLRANYIGSSFRNQGRMVLYKRQGNVQTPIPSLATTLLEDNYTTTVPLSRKSEYTFYTPDDHQLLSYNNYVANFQYSSSAIDRRPLLLMVEGGDREVPQSFEFEAVAYFEVIGPNMTLSTSHSDPSGLGAVLSSLPIKNPVAPPEQVEKGVFERVWKEISEQSASIAVNAAGRLPQIAMNMAGNYFNPLRQQSYPTIEFADM